jgi:hypothetical protein
LGEGPADLVEQAKTILGVSAGRIQVCDRQMAPQGAICIFGFGLHPSCALIVWLSAVLAAQNSAIRVWLCWPALVMNCIPRWLRLIYRARWLLLTLWLIMAYNAPGEAWLDQSWAPTYEGMAEKSAGGEVVGAVALAGLAFVRLVGSS